MKKLTAMMLCATLALGLSACGSRDSSGSASSAETSATQEETADADESTAKEDDSTDSQTAEAQSGKALVVYYSASGNTARVAQEITDAAGADLFEIVPTEVYTDDDLNWSDDNSLVSREHDDESLREVPLTTTEVENWDSYDPVLIGYPIWWGIAAWPVDNFIKNNDFTGKTVIPFCTSASSGMGDSGKLLEKMAGTGNWQEGERFRSGASDSDVQTWVEELGLTK